MLPHSSTRPRTGPVRCGSEDRYAGHRRAPAMIHIVDGPGHSVTKYTKSRAIEPRGGWETEPGEFSPTMIIAALLLAALSVGGQVFHEPLCGNLPEVRPEVKAWVAQVAPELAQVSVRELPEQTALDVFVARRRRAGGVSTSSPTACSGSRAPSISPERRFAPWTRPSCWTSSPPSRDRTRKGRISK